MPKTAATQWIRLALGSFLILLTLFGQAAWAALNVRYQDNIQGGATLFGNSFYLQTNDWDGAYPILRADVDGDPSTSISSSSDLVLPPGATVVKAFLSVETMYGIVVGSADFDSVKFKTPGGSYTTLNTASAGYLTRNIFNDAPGTGSDRYYRQMVFDVTSLLPTTPTGTYTVADPSPRNDNTADVYNQMGGWALTVVYRNPSATAQFRNITVADNWNFFNTAGEFVNVDIPNVIVPSAGTVNAVVGMTGTYGDPLLTDYVRVGNAAGVLTVLTDPTTGRNNDALDGSIGWAANNNVSADGGPIISGNYTARNPNTGFSTNYSAYYATTVTSAMYDADIFNATGAIPANATPITVRVQQNSDGGDWLISGTYFVSVDLPAATLTKTMSPATVSAGTKTTYTFTIANTAPGNVNLTGLGFTDSLPSALIVASPNGVTLNNCTGASVTAVPGTGSISVGGLSLAAGQSCSVSVDAINKDGFSNEDCASNPAAFTNGSSNITTTSGLLRVGVTAQCLLVTPVDRSDAPAGYGAPTHTIVAGTRLGATVTTENAAYNSANADGDVDDGITLPPLTQSQTSTITATVAGAGGYLQGWIDFNGDGDFADAGEQVATNLQDGGALDTNATAGTIAFTVTVPAGAVTTPTYARFRWSTTTGLGATAAASDGEVEDYTLTVAAAATIPNTLTPVPGAPALTCPGLVSNGDFENATVGDYWTPNRSGAVAIANWSTAGGGTDSYGQIITGATAVVGKSLYFGNGGVKSVSPAIPGGFTYDANLLATNTPGAITIRDLTDDVVGVTGSSPGTTTQCCDYAGQPVSVSQTVATTAGQTYRLHFSTKGEGGSGATGIMKVEAPGGIAHVRVPAVNQPADDYTFEFTATAATSTITFTNYGHFYQDNGGFCNPATSGYCTVNGLSGGQQSSEAVLDNVEVAPVSCSSDRSDANASYGEPTHILVSGIQLGAAIDADATSIASTNADGDGTDDDGISSFPTLTAGASSYSIPAAGITASGTGTLHAWVDFDKDGAFSASEYASTTVTAGALAGNLSWTGITVGAAGTTHARFRLTSTTLADLAPTPAVDERATAAANDGEVEDYALTIAGGLQPFACTSDLYQVYSTSGQLAHIDLVNGALINAPNNAGHNINAAGYRPSDNLAYGIRPSARELIVIGADGKVSNRGVITGLPGAVVANTGDFGPDGYLHIRDQGSATVYRVNVDTVAVASSYTLSPNPPNLTDIAYSQATGLFYGVGATGNNRLYSINPSTGATTNIGPSGVGETDGWGAAFADALGRVFAARNTNGWVYSLNLSTGKATKVGNGAAATVNDGFFCPSATLLVGDRSDAPLTGTSYGEATHTTVDGFSLGATLDADIASIANADASGDGADDDGITLPALTQVQTSTITATVAGAGGYLQGWIDFNGDGDFADAGEQVATNLQDGGALDTNATAGTVAFTVNVPATAVTTQTFARFRWASTAGLDSTAAANDGEVEDYALTISPPNADDQAIATCPVGTVAVPVNLIQNPSFESYSTCPGLSSGLTIPYANNWYDTGITGGQLMVNTPSCVSPRPSSSWSTTQNMASGAEGVAWLGMHSLSATQGEGATNSLSSPLLPGNTYVGHFATTRVTQPPFTADGKIAFYGIASTDMGTYSSAGMPAGQFEPLYTTNTISNILNWGTRSLFSLNPTQQWNYLRVEARADAGVAYLYFDDFHMFECKAPRDYGDAPVSYGSASHAFPATAGMYLGTAPGDAETTAQADDGTDEDGITLPTLMPGQTATITAKVTGAGGYLQGWVDFNGDGDFADAGEQVATNIQDNLVGDTDNTAGTIKFNMAVPATAVTTPTYARFRWASTAGLTSIAAASNGEVEDYPVSVYALPPISPKTCRVLYIGSSALAFPNNWKLRGFTVDRPNLTLANVDSYLQTAPLDNYDVVWLNAQPSSYSIAGTAALQDFLDRDKGLYLVGEPFTASQINPVLGLMNTFVDPAAGGGSIALAGTTIGVANHTLNPSVGGNIATYPNLLTPNITTSGAGRFSGIANSQHTIATYASTPAGVAFGSTAMAHGRGRLSVYLDSNVFNDFATPGSNNRDLNINLFEFLADDAANDCTGLDRSDAPASYTPTTHGTGSSLVLGSLIDADPSPIDSSNASGDSSDDDGITLPVLTQGQAATLSANVIGAGGYLQGWVDFNGDGDFADAGEQVATNLQDGGALDTNAAAGIIAFAVNVPTTASTSPTFARFRWASTTGLNSTAAANDGEVEDYALTILPGGYTVSGKLFRDTNVDGVANGTEKGIKDVTIVLYDSANGTCRSTHTGADGSYRFMGVEPATANNYVVYEAAGEKIQTPTTCPPAANDPSGFLSTTANSQTLTVTNADVGGVNFGDVQQPLFELDNQKTILPGTTVAYPHLFRTPADGVVDFSLATAADPSQLAWGTQLYLDNNCDAKLGSGDTVVDSPLALLAGDKLCLLVKVLAPTNASAGATHTVEISSTFSFGDGSSGLADVVQTHTDITTTSSGTSPEPVGGEGKLSLTKSVWNVTRNIDGAVALPGETLRYTIAYENVGNGTLYELVVNDSVPEFTQLVPGSLLCTDRPAGLPACTANSSADGSLDWTWAAGDKLAPGAHGSVSYQVVVE